MVLHGVVSSALRNATTHTWTRCNRRRSWHKGSLVVSETRKASSQCAAPAHGKNARGAAGARGGGSRGPRLLKVPGGGSCGGGLRSRLRREGVWCERHWASTRPHSAPRHEKGGWSSHWSVLHPQHQAPLRTSTRAFLTRAHFGVSPTHSPMCGL